MLKIVIIGLRLRSLNILNIKKIKLKTKKLFKILAIPNKFCNFWSMSLEFRISISVKPSKKIDKILNNPPKIKNVVKAGWCV